MGRPKLHRDSRTLKSFTGHRVPVLGLVMCQVEHNNQKCRLAARVVQEEAGPVPNLMGRDWLQTLKLVHHHVRISADRHLHNLSYLCLD